MIYKLISVIIIYREYSRSVFLAMRVVFEDMVTRIFSAITKNYAG
jgi:hypothetical protein